MYGSGVSAKKPDDSPAGDEPTDGSSIGTLRRELARGTAELAVLSVLATGRRYGYELLKRLQRMDGDWEFKEGTLYPLLHRLEDGGYIEGEWQAEGRGRPRKYYVLTKTGLARAELLRSEWAVLIDSMRRLLTQLDGERP